MASLQQHRPGRYRVRYYLEGKTRCLYLPKISKKQALAVLEKTERLIESRLSGEPPPQRVTAWLAEVGPELHQRLATAGLTKSRRVYGREALAAYVDAFISEQKTKPATRRNQQVARDHLVEHFGPEKLLTEITPGDADRFARELKLAPSTAGLTVRLARQFFRTALRDQIIESNPFSDVRAEKSKASPNREYITTETVQQVLAECADRDARTVLALCRFAGFRHVSETFALEVAGINWHRDRIQIDSPKTGPRVLPIFADLRPWLLDAVENAPDRAVKLIQTESASTIKTHLAAARKAAGVATWPREFHNCRSSCQTDLQRQFPEHVVCAWLGNSPKVAREHYLQVTEQDFETASRATKRATAAADST